MDRRVSPQLAVVVIVIAGAALSAFFYVRANSHPPPIKPAVAIRDPQLQQALRQKFQEMHSRGTSQ